MFETIKDLIKKKLGDVEFELGPPTGGVRGHIATNAGFVLAGIEKKSPAEAAGELKKYLEDESPKGFIEKIEIAGAGFLNIWLTSGAIQSEFKKIAKEKPFFAKATEGKKRIIVEYSQPNIAKPMHVGHLRSTIIGDALANILEFAGDKVVRWNYLGDWGTQFGKLIVAYRKWGDDEKIEKDPINELNDLYVRFHKEVDSNPKLEDEAREEFKKLEDGDRENRKLWEKFKEESLKEFGEMYEVLGIKFDEWIGEAFYEKEMGPLTEKLTKSGIAKMSEGALVVPLDEKGLPPGLIRKSDGATLYLTRDIANLEYRIKKYKADTILYVVDNGQSLHFEQLFAIAEKTGLEFNASHIKFGLVLSEDMKKLSTRAGRHISLKGVIDESVSRARKVVDEKQPDLNEEEKAQIAKVVGIGALKYNDLSQNRQSDIAFNWDKMLSLEGNSGPYLQYTYTRLASILGKAGRIGKLKESELQSEPDINLILKLAMFPETIHTVTENYFPHYLANYLYNLAREANAYYEKEPVLKAEGDLRDARLHLVKAVAETLKTGLGLLGIGTVERM